MWIFVREPLFLLRAKTPQELPNISIVLSLHPVQLSCNQRSPLGHYLPDGVPLTLSQPDLLFLLAVPAEPQAEVGPVLAGALIREAGLQDSLDRDWDRLAGRHWRRRTSSLSLGLQLLR